MSPGSSRKFGALPSAMSCTLTRTFTSCASTRRVTEVLFCAAVLVNPPASVTAWMIDMPSWYGKVPGFWTSPNTNTFLELYSLTSTETCGSRMYFFARQSRMDSALPLAVRPLTGTLLHSGKMMLPSVPTWYTPDSSGSWKTRTSRTSPAPSVEATGSGSSAGPLAVGVSAAPRCPQAATTKAARTRTRARGGRGMVGDLRGRSELRRSPSTGRLVRPPHADEGLGLVELEARQVRRAVGQLGGAVGV